MNRIICTNTKHEFANPGVVFPFDLAKYLFSTISCTAFYAACHRKTYELDSAKLRSRRLANLQKKIEFWSGIFAKTGLRTSSTKLARATQYAQRSISKSLDSIAERSNYVKRFVPTKQDIIDFDIPYGNRQGCYVWEWNPDGRLDESLLLDDGI